jgi:hypothetical protein
MSSLSSNRYVVGVKTRRSNLISIGILAAGESFPKGGKTAIAELETATFFVGTKSEDFV